MNHIVGAITGTFALLAASQHANPGLLSSLAVFALGAIVGCACVVAADYIHRRRIDRRTQRRGKPDRGPDA